MPQPTKSTLSTAELMQLFEVFCQTSAVNVCIKKTNEGLFRPRELEPDYVDVYTNALFKFFKAGYRSCEKSKTSQTNDAIASLLKNPVFATKQDLVAFRAPQWISVLHAKTLYEAMEKIQSITGIQTILLDSEVELEKLDREEIKRLHELANTK